MVSLASDDIAARGQQPMTPTQISPDFAVAPQISHADVAEIAAGGFRSIMCNRPDGEAADQAPSDSIRAEAERHGLKFAHVPVVSGNILPRNVTDFRAALDTLPGPVLAYCRSGARCQNLWMLAQR
jgi:sulfide:quinone oxidoreductase